MSNFVNLLDIVYPIGSVYISFSDVSPVESIGGAWEKIEGKFLQSSDSENPINSTGGISDSLKLTLRYVSYYYNLALSYNAGGDLNLIDFNGLDSIMENTVTKTDSQCNHDTNASTSASIKSIAHPVIINKNVSWENRPAYITCNMYKRIA